MNEPAGESYESYSPETLLARLTETRQQLTECEKMASLGQLTAGIVHEIKNPLNFINNFSELTSDLVKELMQLKEKLSTALSPEDAVYLQELLSDLGNNVQKIKEHGTRAENIIRGMLLYAHGKSGERLPTDINAMLTEYVNLGYHGMRASDNMFNIKMENSYDPSIGMINVVPQDIGRVFLNLINNACYSTLMKKKNSQSDYSPVLLTTTRNLGDHVEIRIRDNGNGIPLAVMEKIFNPFFTTKPAGSGTGLGLSISYDIIVNEHHGEIKVDTKEGEFAEFIITLPK